MGIVVAALSFISVAAVMNAGAETPSPNQSLSIGGSFDQGGNRAR